MNALQQHLLEALRSALRGEAVSWTAASNEELDALMELAALHKVQPLVLQAVYAAPAAKDWQGLSAARRASKVQVMAQSLRTEAFLQLYHFLEKRGSTPVVVKGILCRSLYPDGELRQSADEDLYVAPQVFDETCNALRAYGMTCDPKADLERDHEVGWRMDSLYVELHRSLFSPDMPARFQEAFPDAFRRSEVYSLPNGAAVRSLCPHDHLLYLLLHAYKHFIHSGFGIRQVCDIGLWAQRYAARVDWERLRVQCKALHAERFAAAVFRIAREDLGLTLPPVWEEIEADQLPMLEDILSAGIYGTADKSRQHSAALTFSAATTGGRGGVAGSLFPPAKYLMRDYPILRRHVWRLPLVWLRRIFRYCKETRRERKNSPLQSLKLSAERKRLLKYYGII